MIRSLIFFFSFLLALFATVAALPLLVDKVHLEKSLSLALGTDVTLERIETLSLLPSPRIETSGMRVLESEDPEQLLLQGAQRGLSPAMLGLTEADSITLRLSWRRFLADGGLDSLVLRGAKLAPQLENARLMPFVRRLASRSQGAEIEVQDTLVTPSRAGASLPSFHIEQLTIRTNGEGDRLVSGRVHVQSSDPNQDRAPVAVGIELSLKPLRYLGDGLLQSFDLRLSSNAASSPLGALSANVVGSMQFEEGKAPRLSATLVVRDGQELVPKDAGPILQARLSWQDEALSMTEIAANVSGWQLSGNYWPAGLASEEQAAGLNLVATGLPSRIESLEVLPQRLAVLREDLDRAFSLLALVGLGDLPVGLQVPRADFGELFVEDLDLVMRRDPAGYAFERLAFNTIANGRFEGRAGHLGDGGLVLEGQFSCSSPSVMLAELGLQTADLRQRSSLPELLAEGRLNLTPDGVNLELERLALAGDSIRLALKKSGDAPWQFEAEGARLNADYLNQDLAPTHGLAEAPVAWLEQRLAGLPDFDAKLNLTDLTVGGLPLGQVQGSLAWRAKDAALTIGRDASESQKAQAFQISNVLDAALAVRGQVWFSAGPQGGIEALHQFAMVVNANNDRAFLPNRLVRDLGALANAATPFGIFAPSTATGLQGLSLSASLGSSTPPSTVVRLRSQFRDGSAIEIATAIALEGRLAEQTQRPLSAVWSVKNARGLDLKAHLGPDLAQLVPVGVTALEGRLEPGLDASSYAVSMQVAGDAAQGKIEIETYPSTTLSQSQAQARSPINQLDWVLDYDLSGIALPSQASDALLLDQPQNELSITGQLSVHQRPDGLKLTAQNARLAGLEISSLDLLVPPVSAGSAAGVSGAIHLARLQLGGPGGGDAVALWPLESLSGHRFSVNLGIDRLGLGGLWLSEVDLTALSDGVTVGVQPVTARLGQQALSGQMRLSLGILPQLQVNARIDALRHLTSVKGTPLDLEVSVTSGITALGTNLASMIQNANADLEVGGFAMVRASQPLTLLADYAGRLALDLGPAKALRLQELIFDALANKSLPLSGRMRWVDGVLRSSAGLRLGGDTNYLRLSGRLSVAGEGSNGQNLEQQPLNSQELDLDLSLFGDDDLIPKAALEITGTARRPRFQAFGSALD